MTKILNTVLFGDDGQQTLAVKATLRSGIVGENEKERTDYVKKILAKDKMYSGKNFYAHWKCPFEGVEGFFSKGISP